VSHTDYIVFLTCFYLQGQQLFPYKVNPVPRREGSFAGDSEGYAKSGSKNRCPFPQVLFLGNMEGYFFPGAFERREKFLYLGKFYEEFERYVKSNALSTGSSLHRGPVGELEGGLLTGTFERKR
jgi:hypothetical protein